MVAMRRSAGDRASQRCGWAACAASLRRPARCAGSPALLAPRGDFDNSALSTGPQTRRSRRGIPLQPRCAALLGAAEAPHPPPTRTSARTDSAARDSASQRACSWRSSSSRSVLPARPWAGERRSASAAPRSAGARGLRIASRRCVERSLSEHRAQAARAARCRPCKGEFCARPRAPSTAGESAQCADRRGGAQPLARPRPCSLARS